MKVSRLTQHEEGQTYFSTYWQESYFVEEVHDTGWVTVVWSTGKVTTHCTPKGKDPVFEP